MPSNVKRRPQRSRPHIIDRHGAIRLVASPLRQAILDAISAEGPLSVAALSGLCGRPPDRLYYHVKRLLVAGLLKSLPDRGRGREARFEVAGRPMYIRYDPADRANRRAVVSVLNGMLRAAGRDFRRAFRPGITAQGPRRRLWVSRVEGTLTDADIARLNRLLSAAIALVMSGRQRAVRGARVHQLTWVSSPGRESSRD